MGAAFFAGLAVGFWENLEEIRSIWCKDRDFTPSMPNICDPLPSCYGSRTFKLPMSKNFLWMEGKMLQICMTVRMRGLSVLLLIQLVILVHCKWGLTYNRISISMKVGMPHVSSMYMLKSLNN